MSAAHRRALGIDASPRQHLGGEEEAGRVGIRFSVFSLLPLPQFTWLTYSFALTRLSPTQTVGPHTRTLTWPTAHTGLRHPPP
jgi:hypothetical protein